MSNTESLLRVVETQYEIINMQSDLIDELFLLVANEENLEELLPIINMCQDVADKRKEI